MTKKSQFLVFYNSLQDSNPEFEAEFKIYSGEYDKKSKQGENNRKPRGKQ
jgi:hypothetical protein